MREGAEWLSEAKTSASKKAWRRWKIQLRRDDARKSVPQGRPTSATPEGAKDYSPGRKSSVRAEQILRHRESEGTIWVITPASEWLKQKVASACGETSSKVPLVTDSIRPKPRYKGCSSW